MFDQHNGYGLNHTQNLILNRSKGKQYLLEGVPYYFVERLDGVFKKYPQIKDIAENRYPDLKEKFEYFKNYRKHFIGPIQSNKIKKIVQHCDVIQSVSKLKHLKKNLFYT